MGHIWIGSLEPPVDWMESWREKNPEWEYKLYDNAYLDNTEFETRRQINEYLRRGWYAGAADLMRYEILWREGGFLAEADSINLHAIDPLFEDDFEIYTVYENEFLRGKLVSPILASVPRHPFLRLLIDTLKEVDPSDLDVAWKQTGNKFVAEMIEKHRPAIKIWPSHTMIPEHKDGWTYNGTEKVYARQFFGSTRKIYKSGKLFDKFLERRKKKYATKTRKRLKSKLDRMFLARLNSPQGDVHR